MSVIIANLMFYCSMLVVIHEDGNPLSTQLDTESPLLD